MQHSAMGKQNDLLSVRLDGGVMGSVIANEWVVESVQEFKSDTRRLPLKSNKMINVL